MGSPSSRAAVRMLLKQKERVEERKTNRPPDVRMVFDLPRHSVEVVSASAERARGYRVDRYVDGEVIVEIVFPTHAYIGECPGRLLGADGRQRGRGAATPAGESA